MRSPFNLPDLEMPIKLGPIVAPVFPRSSEMLLFRQFCAPALQVSFQYSQS